MNDNVDLQNLANDLAPFADLGTAPPSVVVGPSNKSLNLVRNGDDTRIEAQGTALFEFIGTAAPLRHSSFKALLASERYGAMRSWAAQQSLLLRTEISTDDKLIEQTGLLNSSIEEIGLAAIDDVLAASQTDGTTRVMLIDGPAGIGKTNFINYLSLRRSDSITQLQRPLLLHVESRGRQLSYIYDLIAFSLQRLRSRVTFDQIPVLVKHGLVTIAIDGFDELADPNGIVWRGLRSTILLRRLGVTDPSF